MAVVVSRRGQQGIRAVAKYIDLLSHSYGPYIDTLLAWWRKEVENAATIGYNETSILTTTENTGKQ